jgi:hypothetical protein
MQIGFTGHRDRYLSEPALEALAEEFPGAVWVHGGAAGFDTQVAVFARAYHIPQEVIRPDYHLHHPKRAPLLRNEIIVNRTELLVACYDGRTTGGTYYTVRYARRLGRPVRILRPAEHQE